MSVIEVSSDGSFDMATSAAAHTYDKGYARWEKFDQEEELTVVDEKSRISTKSDEDDLDFSLSLFEKMDQEQRDGARRVLKLTEKQIASLPEDQAETLRQFRELYRQQKTNKDSPPIPGAAAASTAQRRLDPMEKLHAELEKMSSWCSFAEAEEKWYKVEKREDESERRRRDDDLALRALRVDKAVEEVMEANSKSMTAQKQVRKSQKSKNAKEKASRERDRRTQIQAIRDLAASSTLL